MVLRTQKDLMIGGRLQNESNERAEVTSVT